MSAPEWGDITLSGTLLVSASLVGRRFGVPLTISVPLTGGLRGAVDVLEMRLEEALATVLAEQKKNAEAWKVDAP